MKILVAGLWHLGCVTAACCAKHFPVTGLEFDRDLVAKLQQGRAPLLEPGLDTLLAEGLASGRLRFTADAAEAGADADLLWLTYDTPVDDQDQSDAAFVLGRLRQCLAHLRPGVLVLISSQLPVGTCAQLEKEFPQFRFACSPENLRLGKALEAFQKADRVIVGVRSETPKAILQELFAPFTSQVLFMRTESAEMVKHALNSFLAVSITFINEIARLCEQVGADAREVSAGLKSDARIGPRAYLGPGGPFAGGTLARDVVTLTKLGERHGEELSLIPAIKPSNDRHRQWVLRRLEAELNPLAGRTVGLLGLTYTPNTSTLRRSAAVELGRQLLARGARVQAFDPAIREPAEPLAGVRLCASASEAAAGAEAVVICTEWPEFRQLPWADCLAGMRNRLVVDANGFLHRELAEQPGLRYLSVGRPAASGPAG